MKVGERRAVVKSIFIKFSNNAMYWIDLKSFYGGKISGEALKLYIVKVVYVTNGLNLKIFFSYIIDDTDVKLFYLQNFSFSIR